MDGHDQQLDSKYHGELLKYDNAYHGFLFRSLSGMISPTLLSFADTSSAGWFFSRAFYATKPGFILGVNI